MALVCNMATATRNWNPIVSVKRMDESYQESDGIKRAWAVRQGCDRALTQYGGKAGPALKKKKGDQFFVYAQRVFTVS